MHNDEYLQEIERCGGQHIALERKQRWEALQRWREVFAARYHAAKDKWKKLGDFEWHVFASGYTSALHGERAVEAYESQQLVPFFVVPESERRPAFRCEGVRWPNFRPVADDVYVWSEDLNWTMAFTHEEDWGLGPYFCRREWVYPTDTASNR